MLRAAEYTKERLQHPVDVVEQLAAANDWSFDRDTEDEISIAVAGGWTDYQVAFTWLADIETLHVSCAFDFKSPDRRRPEIATLISSINEQLWAGHFDQWPNEGVVMHRHGLLLVGGAPPSAAQCAALLDNGISACERYYQAFQFVLWAGKSARQAIESATFETKGQA